MKNIIPILFILFLTLSAGAEYCYTNDSDHGPDQICYSDIEVNQMIELAQKEGITAQEVLTKLGVSWEEQKESEEVEPISQEEKEILEKQCQKDLNLLEHGSYVPNHIAIQLVTEYNKEGTSKAIKQEITEELQSDGWGIGTNVHGKIFTISRDGFVYSPEAESKTEPEPEPEQKKKKTPPPPPQEPDTSANDDDNDEPLIDWGAVGDSAKKTVQGWFGNDDTTKTDPESPNPPEDTTPAEKPTSKLNIIDPKSLSELLVGIPYPYTENDCSEQNRVKVSSWNPKTIQVNALTGPDLAYLMVVIGSNSQKGLETNKSYPNSAFKGWPPNGMLLNAGWKWYTGGKDINSSHAVFLAQQHNYTEYKNRFSKSCFVNIKEVPKTLKNRNMLDEGIDLLIIVVWHSTEFAVETSLVTKEDGKLMITYPSIHSGKVVKKSFKDFEKGRKSWKAEIFWSHSPTRETILQK